MKRFWAFTSILTMVILILTACVAPTPVVVKETVVVEKQVVQTQIVEKPVVQTQVVEKIVERKVEVTPKVTPAPEELSGTLIVGRGGDSVWLDVGPATDGESWRVVCEINDALVRQEGTTTKIIPWLATSWET
jgi:ABC-type transport system substrate-binding protein